MNVESAVEWPTFSESVTQVSLDEVNIGDQIVVVYPVIKGSTNIKTGIVGRITPNGTVYALGGGSLVHPGTLREPKIYVLAKTAYEPPAEQTERLIRVIQARGTNSVNLRGLAGLFKWNTDRKVWNNFGSIHLYTSEILEWGEVEVTDLDAPNALSATSDSWAHDDTHDTL